MSLSIFNTYSQVTTTSNLGGLLEVEQIQEAFGDINTAIRQTAEAVADATNAGRERAGAEVLLEFSGIRIFSETFVPLNSNARTSSNDKNKPKAGTVLQLNAAYKDDYVKVYPNPNNGKFFVEYTINAMETGSFVLTDISGKEMWRRTLTKNKGTLILDQNTPPGIYLYQIIVNGEVFTIDKLIITQ